MKIRGIGIDMEAVARFRRLPYGRSRSFYEKIFTAGEIQYCLSKPDPYPHFAARFAGKEAVIKAISGTIYESKKIEIVNRRNGQPAVKGQTNIKLSLSHTKDYALAVALVL